MNYQDLIDDHDQIDAFSEQLEMMVRHQDGTSSDVNALIGRLAAIVTDHLCKEDSFIYPQLAASSDPADSASLIDEFEEIKRDWQMYLAAWQAGEPSNNWEKFRSSTLGMLARLRSRVMKETGLLYGMALREGLITMKPAA
ncbi:hemerythrin domain-containing protein [Sphingomonas sp. BAUL-RG-20F-R05-02]|uniref:hemerythrin domain-containing protein n=1 Tax=Sphingomonas sp. BAUL-RG-20F-R05-02 TaxID=2914830 RepID=UPI001F59A165|nr:hemerythrin domain-containing protein [Sphingomonas sp. BAUL-RG-20F-R05-02]